jgi:two-component system chemotaxis response regulator CheB
LLAALPSDFPIPIAIVQHRTMVMPDRRPQVFGRRTALLVKLAEDGEIMKPGTAYVAPAQAHLILKGDQKLALTDSSKIQFLRSSANPLFSSAAKVLDGRVIAVVLTGGRRDVINGVQEIRKAGSFVIAQDWATSESHSMPHSAIATGCVNRVLLLEQIGPALVNLTIKPLPETNGRMEAAI